MDASSFLTSSGDASLFTDAAQLAAAPENPLNWVKTGADLIKNLGGLFGGGGTYVSNTGYGFIGQVTKDGFTPGKSTVTTYLSNGDSANWNKSPGWNEGTNASWHDVFDPLNKAFASLFATLGNQEITLNVRSPTKSTALTAAIAQQLQSVKTMAAPDTVAITGATDPTGASVPATSSAPPSAGGAAAGGAAPIAAPAQVPPVAVALAIALAVAAMGG